MEARKFLSPLKACAFFLLTAMAANVFAGGIYLGNPNRPDTVWQPAQCVNGCMHEGYYIKFLGEPKCRDVAWVEGQYNRNGDWVSGHYQVVRYVVVNPGSEGKYPGYPM